MTIDRTFYSMFENQNVNNCFQGQSWLYKCANVFDINKIRQYLADLCNYNSLIQLTNANDRV